MQEKPDDCCCPSIRRRPTGMTSRFGPSHHHQCLPQAVAVATATKLTTTACCCPPAALCGVSARWPDSSEWMWRGSNPRMFGSVATLSLHALLWSSKPNRNWGRRGVSLPRPPYTHTYTTTTIYNALSAPYTHTHILSVLYILSEIIFIQSVLMYNLSI